MRGRSENLWSTEQTSLVELVDDQDIIAKTVYTLSNPVKDQLVEKAHQWPGATSLQGTLAGRVLRARRPRRFFSTDGEMPKEIELTCVLPPALRHGAAEFAAAVRAGIRRAETDAATERRSTGRRVLGRKAILSQRPTDRPRSRKPLSKLNPRVAAQDKEPRIEAITRLKEFYAAYTSSRVTWREGGKVVFPAGTWWLRRFAPVECVELPESG